MKDGYVLVRKNLRTLFMSTASKKLKITSRKEKYLQMEILILQGQDATTYFQTVNEVKEKLKGDYSDKQIEECLYDLYVDIKAEQNYYNVPKFIHTYD